MNLENMLNNKIKDLKPSGIRRFFDMASEYKDIVSLGVGDPDFDTPWHIRQEAIKALQEGRTFYTANAGLKELREEVCIFTEGRHEMCIRDRRNTDSCTRFLWRASGPRD